MRRVVISFLFLGIAMLFCTSLLAQVEIQSQPFNGKLKIEPYYEYIRFNGDDLRTGAGGGGLLFRYLFLDWLGAQTNFTFYAKAGTNKLDGNLSFQNWRLTALLHTYIDGLEGPMPLYVYGGGGGGYQFNSGPGNRDVSGAWTGHVLAGIGYDFHEKFHIEAEAGYQFGKADITNYTKDSINVDGYFIRAGIGFRL